MQPAVAESSPASPLAPFDAPLPLLPHVRAVAWSRLSGIIKGIVYYGILAFGVAVPLLGALYASLFL